VLQALICHTLDKKCFTRPKIVDGLLFWEPEAFDQARYLAASLVFFCSLTMLALCVLINLLLLMRMVFDGQEKEKAAQ
jgi:hypothetical protein